MKKNLILGIVGLTMVASLVGCGSANKETAADVTTPNEEVVAEVTDNEVATEVTDEVADEATESTEETPTTPRVKREVVKNTEDGGQIKGEYMSDDTIVWEDGTVDRVLGMYADATADDGSVLHGLTLDNGTALMEDGTIRYFESEAEETSAESTDFTSTGLAYNTAFKNKDTDYSITYTVLEDGTVAYHTESKSELGISEWDDTYTLEKVLDYGNDFYGIVVKGTFNEFEYYTFLYKKSNPDNVVWVLSTADTVELANYLYDNTTKDTKATDGLNYNGKGVSTEMYTVEK